MPKERKALELWLHDRIEQAALMYSRDEDISFQLGYIQAIIDILQKAYDGAIMSEEDYYILLVISENTVFVEDRYRKQ